MTPQLRGLFVTVEGSVQTFAVSTAWAVPAPALFHPVRVPLCPISWVVMCWPSFCPAFPFKTPVKLLKSSVKMVVAPAVPLKQARIPETVRARWVRLGWFIVLFWFGCSFVTIDTSG